LIASELAAAGAGQKTLEEAIAAMREDGGALLVEAKAKMK